MESRNPSVKLDEGQRLHALDNRALFWFACSILAISVLLSGMAVLFAFLNTLEPVLDVVWVAIVLAVPFPAVGALILWKRPGNAIG